MPNRFPVTAVTGAAGYIGTLLLYELEKEEDLPLITALDVNPLRLPVRNVVSVRHDVTHPLDQVIRDRNIDTVVHLAFNFGHGTYSREDRIIQEGNLSGLSNVLKACHAGKVANLIYVSSYTVYGAYKDNPIPITEESPMRPLPGFQYSYLKWLSESMIRSFSDENPDIRITVLRPSVVLGPTANNMITDALFQRIFLGIAGYNPPMQFVHENDLARLLCLLVREPHSGIFNVAGERVVHYRKLATLSQRKPLIMPSPVANALTALAWKTGIQKHSSPVGLDFIRYPILISTGKLKKETGFRFRYTSEDALMSYLMGRPI